MSITISRRVLIAAAATAAAVWQEGHARQPTPAAGSGRRWSLPIRNTGDVPGDGFVIRHGFASENTWFNPGWLHTAEDWYRSDGRETAGAEVVAATDGEVLWIGSDYPGRVVLVQHREGLIGMYGHLDYDVSVAEGDRVETGQPLGQVLPWTDGRAPSHLHFEMRDFFISPVVNGDAPVHPAGCGVQCPPGPGYWPIGDARHPAEVGWRNPSHVIAQGMSENPPDAVVIASTAQGRLGLLRTEPDTAAAIEGEFTMTPGERLQLLDIDAGEAAPTEVSALGYDVWYRIGLPDGRRGWSAAYAVDDADVDSSGRPTTLIPLLLPVVPEVGS